METAEATARRGTNRRPCGLAPPPTSNPVIASQSPCMKRTHRPWSGRIRLCRFHPFQTRRVARARFAWQNRGLKSAALLRPASGVRKRRIAPAKFAIRAKLHHPGAFADRRFKPDRIFARVDQLDILPNCPSPFGSQMRVYPCCLFIEFG